MKRPIIAVAYTQYIPGRMGPQLPSAPVERFALDAHFRDGKLHPIDTHNFNDRLGEALTRYLNFVILGGGIPFAIPLLDRTDFIADLLDRVDGVLLTGGDDLSPSFYSESPIAPSCLGNLSRTWQETAVIREAVSRKLPLFGICRGFQQLAVNFGGSLYQDIPTQCPTELEHYRGDGVTYHNVNIDSSDGFADAFPMRTFPTNTWHHQAMKSPGEHCTVVGRAPDGIIEAAEWKAYRAFAVQWHPERLIDHPISKSMATYFIDQCRNRT